MATVGELITYPVKGCAGVSLAEAELGPAGLPHDRAFMVTDADGVFRSQRKDPRLALVRPEVSPDGSLLSLAAPRAGRLDVGIDLAAPRRDVRLFNDRYQGVDQGEEAARWLTAFLGAPSRLVAVPPEHDRVSDGLTPGTSGYADGSAVHAISLASLADLNARMPGSPLPMSRFRPNLTIDGWREPYREDLAREIAIGGAVLGFAKAAIRCAVTLVDQPSGARSGPEPLRTLAGYRRTEAGVAFGAKFAVVRPGTLRVGAELDVRSWAPDGVAAGR